MLKREGIVAVSEDRLTLGWWCEGCNHLSTVSLAPGRWTWNGDVNKPTVKASYRAYWSEQKGAAGKVTRPEITRCHTWLTDGVVEYLPDAQAYTLRGKRPLLPIPAGYGGVD